MEKKSTEKDLEYFFKKEFIVVLKKRGDCFVLYIPELCIFAQDENLADAFKKLEAEKMKYFKAVIDYDLQDIDNQFRGVDIKKQKGLLVQNLVPFIIKLLIIIFIGIIGMGVISKEIRKRANPEYLFLQTNRMVNELNKKIGSMSDEKKEELMLKLKKVVQNVKPFVDEFRILLEDDSKNIPKRAQFPAKGSKDEKNSNP